MRAIASFVAALCLGHASASAQPASGPIPVETQVMSFDGAIQGSLTSADNRWGGLIFDCHYFTRPTGARGLDFGLRNAGDQKVVVGLMDGDACEVTEDTPMQFLDPGEQVAESIYGTTSLLVGSQTPVSYKLEALAVARDDICIASRGSRELRSGRVAYTTLNGKPELVPVVQEGEKWVLHSNDDYPTARALDWFVEQEPIEFGAATYVKYGLPRVLGIGEIEYFGAKDGVFVGKEKGVADAAPEVVYVMIDQVGCEFQPYQKKAAD